MDTLYTPTSRREKALSRCATEIEEVFRTRHRAARERSCCMPLAALLRDLGYTLTPAHPYGQQRTRQGVIDALDMVDAGWHVEKRDLSKLEAPIGLPNGDEADTLWVYFHRKDVTTGYDPEPWSSTERYLKAELDSVRKRLTDAVRALEDELELLRETCREWRDENRTLTQQAEAARTEAEEWQFLVNELKAHIKELEGRSGEVSL
jgi:hypothetical protein